MWLELTHLKWEEPLKGRVLHCEKDKLLKNLFFCAVFCALTTSREVTTALVSCIDDKNMRGCFNRKNVDADTPVLLIHWNKNLVFGHLILSFKVVAK